jgi:UDP-N-acetylmuramyl pentapeptide synthase
VVEVGSNHPGELRSLLALARPSHGVITGIGREHLEFFGELEGVLREEGELARSIPPEGTLFLNTSSGPAGRLVRLASAPVVTVGWDADNPWSARLESQDFSGTVFSVQAPLSEFCGSYRINLLGRHQALNALLALAVGAALGVTSDQARRGLQSCHPLKMRLQASEVGGVRILDDSYNANADSALAALQTLLDLPAAGRRIAVLGDMAELGAQALEAHTEVGRQAARGGIDILCTVGPLSRLAALAARQTGLGLVREFPGAQEAVDYLENILRPGDLVLVKGSRVAGLERIVTALKRKSTPWEPSRDAKFGLPAAMLC